MLPFIRSNASVLTFCSAIGFFTALGQTFLIAQFIPYISESLDLTRTEISSIYSLATLVSSFGLAYLGKLLDRSSLLRFSLVTLLFLALGTTLLGGAVGIISVWLGFFLVRLCGQITLGTISTTTVSRIFGRYRGKVLALTGLGRSLGEGIFPLLAVSLITILGWRWAVVSMGGILLIVMVPISLLIIPGLPKEPLYSENDRVHGSEISEWGWWQLLLEKKALVVMLVNSIIPFIFTGLFFQQSIIGGEKGWSPMLMSSAFIGYSLFKILSSMGWGVMVDRFTAKFLQIFIFFPLIIALLLLDTADSQWGCWAYTSMLGIAMGLYALIRNSYWAEEYGVRFLGEIKGMDSLFLVLGTSVSPLFFSYLSESGVSIAELSWGLIVLCTAGTLTYLSIFFLRKH